MSLIYRWVGNFGILMACLIGIGLVVSIVQGEPSAARDLPSIEAGVFWVVAMVAYGNADRCDAAARDAKYYDSFGR